MSKSANRDYITEWVENHLAPCPWVNMHDEEPPFIQCAFLDTDDIKFLERAVEYW